MVFQECERHPRSPEDIIEDPSHGLTENGKNSIPSTGESACFLFSMAIWRFSKLLPFSGRPMSFLSFPRWDKNVLHALATPKLGW